MINIFILQNWGSTWNHFREIKCVFKIFDIQLLFQELHHKSAICHIGCHMVPYGSRYGKWQIGDIMITSFNKVFGTSLPDIWQYGSFSFSLGMPLTTHILLADKHISINTQPFTVFDMRHLLERMGKIEGDTMKPPNSTINDQRASRSAYHYNISISISISILAKLIVVVVKCHNRAANSWLLQPC